MQNILITVGRQYGSGGREIGEKTAALLGIPFYNEELITLAAKKSELCEEAATAADEKNASSLLYTLAVGSTNMLHMPNYNMPINDRLFLAQSEVIRDIAENGSAVIVGRCADYILREYPNLFSVFIFADAKARAARVAERNNVTETEAYTLIAKTDRRRANYYNFYTGRKWGKLTGYDLAVNSEKLGIDGTAAQIGQFAKAMLK